jgi:sugar lactone lactonase YvrE
MKIFSQYFEKLKTRNSRNWKFHKSFKFLIAVLAGVTTAISVAMYLTARTAPPAKWSLAKTTPVEIQAQVEKAPVTLTAKASPLQKASEVEKTPAKLTAKAATTAKSYTTSWVGNTFGGGKKWVQINVHDLYVTPDGTVYTNTIWDEAGREGGIYKNGDAIAQADQLHGWGRTGGVAVTADEKYIYIAMQQYPDGKPGEDYPPKGTEWHCIRRYDLSGKPAPFPGGRGWDKSMLIVSTKAGGDVTGLATVKGLLYASDNAANFIRVYDKRTMKEVRHFSVPRPGKIAIDKKGNLWVIQSKNGKNPTKILHYSPTGKQLPVGITNIVEPSAIAIDNQGRLLVADNGPRQQILIYDITSQPKQVGTFGIKGGIYAGNRGEIGDLKFYGISGVGVDAAGNIYISNVAFGYNGSGTDLRAFSPSGKLKWQLLGLEFVDNADADPGTDGADVYTKEEHFVMDYRQNSGKEWRYKGYTLDKFRYPDDPRLHFSASSAFVRRVRGKRLLYLSADMMAERLLIYRFNGEIAVPCGMFSKVHSDWPTNQPSKGSWIWQDVNGDGSIQGNEFQSLGADDTSVWGWEIDTKGDVWQAAEAGYIKHYRLQKLDSRGCPVYSRTAMEKIPMPAPIKTLTRIKYFPEQDVMYLSGYTSDRPNLDGDWGLVGTEIIRYDNWSKGRKIRWRAALPYNPYRNPKLHIKAIDIAGNRVFAVSSKTAEVFVYDTKTGAQLKILKPGPEVFGESGWIDIPYGIRAFRRSNGEYLVFVEEDSKAKVLMYRLPA